MKISLFTPSKKFTKFITAITAMAITVVSAAIVMPGRETSAQVVIDNFNDDFNSYEADADIVGFTAVNSSIFPDDGRITPASGYNWAERYNSDSVDNKWFKLVSEEGTEGMAGEIYNGDTTQFYRVSSKNVSGADKNTVIVSGRFCIPDVNELSSFVFAVMPNERYDSRNFEPVGSLLTIKTGGYLYKSVKDLVDTWGASNKSVESAILKSNEWYNVVFTIENTGTRKYTGRLFNDDKTVDIDIKDGYLAQLTSYGDAEGKIARLGFRLGAAASADDANKVYVDDLSISTTNYPYSRKLPKAAGTASVEAVDAWNLSVNVETPFSVAGFKAENITVEDNNGTKTDVRSISTGENGALNLTLSSALVGNREYNVTVVGKDAFLNEVKLTDKVTYEVVEPFVPSTSAVSAFKDDFESYEEGAAIASWAKVGIAAPTYGQVMPTGTYNWAEFLQNENTGFEPVENAQIKSGKISKLYNRSTSLYRVSSKNVTGAAENNIIVSGEFYIPDITKVKAFYLGLAPSNRYSNQVADFNPFITLGKIDSTGGFYNINTKVDGATIESGKWYRYVYIIENTSTKNYKGVLTDSNGAPIANVSGTFTNQTTSRDDSTGNNIRTALQIAASISGSEDANVVYVDDLGIYTADYGFENIIPATDRIAEVAIKNSTTLNITLPSVFSTQYGVNADTITVTDTDGNAIQVTDVIVNEDGSLDANLGAELSSGEAYTVSISGKDVFLNKITVRDSSVYSPDAEETQE